MFRLTGVVVVAVAAAMAALCAALPQQPMDPVMGIFTDPLEECWMPHGAPPPNATQCVESYYVRWLEQSGVRVIPIPWNANASYRTYLLSSVNGILFPGGGLWQPVLGEYIGNFTEVVNQALEWNANGDPFVVWGTCYGFEILHQVIARNLSVSEPGFVGVNPAMLPLNFTKHQPTSRMFGDATTPPGVLKTLATKNSTLNWHMRGITPNGYKYNPVLGQTLRVLSTNVDAKGRTFLSSVEGINAEIYATQYHTERIQFEYTRDIIGHTPGDIRATQYISAFAASRLKLNNHSFASPLMVEALSIHNYPIINYGLGYELYWL